jgi:hypothetical protein
MRPMLVHQMVAEQDNGAEILFVCPVDPCRRRLVLKRRGGVVVLDRGDTSVRHVGGCGPLDLAVAGMDTAS